MLTCVGLESINTKAFYVMDVSGYWKHNEKNVSINSKEFVVLYIPMEQVIYYAYLRKNLAESARYCRTTCIDVRVLQNNWYCQIWFKVSI